MAVFYANPILTGKELIQPDIVHYRGGAQEMLEYRAKTGNETTGVMQCLEVCLPIRQVQSSVETS